MSVPSIQKAWPDGRVEILVTEVDGIPLQAPNDLTFGPDGRLYFTDPADYLPNDRKPGRVFALNPDGTGECLAELPSAYPNGIVAEPDGSIVWVESYDRGVYRIPPGGRSEQIHQLPEGHIPDGLKVDADGQPLDHHVHVRRRGHRPAPMARALDFLETGGVPLNCVFHARRSHHHRLRRRHGGHRRRRPWTAGCGASRWASRACPCSAARSAAPRP